MFFNMPKYLFYLPTCTKLVLKNQQNTVLLKYYWNHYSEIIDWFRCFFNLLLLLTDQTKYEFKVDVGLSDRYYLTFQTIV